jgi:hypothetical protein
LSGAMSCPITRAHDLNGDGMIGITPTLIETNGTPSLVAVADQYAFEAIVALT